MDRFNMLDTVQDTITGFTGKIIARSQWAFTGAQALVQPSKLDYNMKYIDPIWFAESRLKPATETIMAAPANT